MSFYFEEEISENEKNCKEYILKNKFNFSKEEIKKSLLKTQIPEKDIDKYIEKYYTKKKDKTKEGKFSTYFSLICIFSILGFLFYTFSIFIKIFILIFIKLIHHFIKTNNKIEGFSDSESSSFRISDFFTKGGIEILVIFGIFYFGKEYLEPTLIGLFVYYTLFTFKKQHDRFKDESIF